MERIEKLREFLKSNPTDSFLQHALALEYSKIGDDSTARELFEKILEREPSYIGSYYHLAKLLERMGDNDAAIQWYEKGMEAAKKAGDNHALGELRSAYEELTFE
jgi:Tfp pilus assembly protein PilF